MKKIISMILVFTMIFSTSAFIFAENGHLEKLEGKGLIEKLDDGTYGLDKTITRGETVRIAVKLLGFESEISQEKEGVY